VRDEVGDRDEEIADEILLLQRQLDIVNVPHHNAQILGGLKVVVYRDALGKLGSDERQSRSTQRLSLTRCHYVSKTTTKQRKLLTPANERVSHREQHMQARALGSGCS
jgi:hypothetical protein